MRAIKELRIGQLLFLVLAMFTVLCQPGCRSVRKCCEWQDPQPVLPEQASHWGEDQRAPWEQAYSTAIGLEKAGECRCVDYFYQAAVLAWSCVEYDLRNRTNLNGRARDVYHSSLIKLIETAQKHGRFDPRKGLRVEFQDGMHSVPFLVRGFPWKPLEIDKLIPVGQYSVKDLQRKYCTDGLGVPMVAVHCPVGRPFQHQPQRFAATLLLRPVANPQKPFALELVDTIRFKSSSIQGLEVPVRRDLSAPIAYILKEVDRPYFQNFIQPGSSTETTGLFMVEPYQPGKIPVVFVHGLLSDRYTWANMANELRARADLVDRYQILGFEYSTGAPFLTAAATLRRQLTEYRLNYDPQCRDPAMSQMVLIGHSMGGLVAKLQVTASGDQLWKAVANRPFNQIVMTEQQREILGEAFFFDPTPGIGRVIFAGTPHRGSPWALRPVGKLGSCLVEEPEDQVQRHANLVATNPHTFSEEFTRRIPTSVDLLRPDSPLLLAMDNLPANPRVPQHSIIGSWTPMSGAGDSDSVVPVNSAIRKGAVSEKIIQARHTDLHRVDAGVEEIFRILRLHAQQCQMTRPQVPVPGSDPVPSELMPTVPAFDGPLPNPVKTDY